MRPLDLVAIAIEASAAVKHTLGLGLVARVKQFEPPLDPATGEYCYTVEAAMAADALFAEEEHPRPSKPAAIVDLVAHCFDRPWFVVSPSNEERVLEVRDMVDGTWSKDKNGLKEYAKAIEGKLGTDPRSARLYDELADFATKDAPSTVPGTVFASGYMMRYCPHSMPFSHGQMLNLETGSHAAISSEQRIWSSAVLHWEIPAPPLYQEILQWADHYVCDTERTGLDAADLHNQHKPCAAAQVLRPTWRGRDRAAVHRKERNLFDRDHLWAHPQHCDRLSLRCNL